MLGVGQAQAAEGGLERPGGCKPGRVLGGVWSGLGWAGVGLWWWGVLDGAGVWPGGVVGRGLGAGGVGGGGGGGVSCLGSGTGWIVFFVDL